ncbi:MAG: purine-nucleoside phosphorylase [Deltaproteobacteria bacterium]|nr:purine-nucleoside phosphorylase [Deltaproteobacteria bacterium]
MFERKFDSAAEFISSRMKDKPEIGMITGTGLGSVAERISVDFNLPYSEIPHFPVSTVEGHGGKLIFGELAGKTVIVMDGRFHIYEGYSPWEVTLPVRVMATLGIEYLFISSAAGGLNPQFNSGDLMIVTDHINLTGTNPLIGPNLVPFGPRFPDMSQAYNPDMVLIGREKALELGILIRQGVYAGLSGPSLETPAETRFLRLIGADAVGMSTVSEVIVGIHCGLKVMAIAAITNINLPDCMSRISIEQVIETAHKAGSSLSLLWEKIIRGMPH